MAKFCQKCGKKLSFFTRGMLCKDCEMANKAELEKAAKEIIATKNVTEGQIELFKKQEKNSLLNLYSKIYNQFISDKELEEEEINTLRKIQETCNLTNEDIKFDERVRPYIYVYTIRKEGTLPTVNLQIEGGSPVVLKKGEVVHFADSCILKELKSISLSYSGGSHGVSFRVAKGISYRGGS